MVTFEDNKGIKITKERDKRAKITDIESKKSKNYKFLVENYPLCLVENNEFFFTDANPETKRVFLNKTLFYVEQKFNFTENILKKIIKSRSNCLKHQKFDEINYWNDKLVEIEPQITESCTKIIDRFNHEIKNNSYIEVFSEKNAWIKDITNKEDEIIDINHPKSIQELKKYLENLYPELKKHFLQDVLRFAVNQEYVSKNLKLNPIDEIAIFPPVSGG